MKSWPALSFKEANVMVFRRYCNASGRARRSEFWYYFFVFILEFILFGYFLVFSFSFSSKNNKEKKKNFLSNMNDIIRGLLILIQPALIIPLITVAIRRLHDTGKSGFFLIIALIPFLGDIAILFFLVQDSTKGANKYGPSPKYYTDPSDSLVNEVLGQSMNMLQPMQQPMNRNINQIINNGSQLIELQQGNLAMSIPLDASNNLIMNNQNKIMVPMVPNESIGPGIYYNN